MGPDEVKDQLQDVITELVQTKAWSQHGRRWRKFVKVSRVSGRSLYIRLCQVTHRQCEKQHDGASSHTVNTALSTSNVGISVRVLTVRSVSTLMDRTKSHVDVAERWFPQLLAQVRASEAAEADKRKEQTYGVEVIVT